MSISDKVALLQTILTEIQADAIKTDSGNKAAGTRVRKVLKEVENQTKHIRKEVLELRKTEKTEG